MTKKFTTFLVGVGALALAGSFARLIYTEANRPKLENIEITSFFDGESQRRAALINFSNNKSGVFYEVIPNGGKFISADELDKDLSRNDFNDLASNIVYSAHSSNSYVRLNLNEIALMGYKEEDGDLSFSGQSVCSLSSYPQKVEFFFQNPTNKGEYVYSSLADKIGKTRKHSQMENTLKKASFSGY